MQIFSDESLPADAMARILPALRDFTIAASQGETHSPARTHTALGGGDMIFTVGSDAAHYGFRAYDTLDQPQDAQLIAAWQRGSGRLLGLAHGVQLGALRTGALGGLAADALAPTAGPLRVGVIGSGRQAATQIAALHCLREITQLRVFSRNTARASAFAKAHGGQHSTTPRAAVEGMDVVILATNAAQPVIEADWISDAAHVTTLGPKFACRHEMPPALAARTGTLASDSPAQIAAQKDHILRADPALERLIHLGALLEGRAKRQPGLSLFLSAGLAGSEVAALAALCQTAPQSPSKR